MAAKPRNKMSIENRAKQFMPFAALKGLPEALAAKEKLHDEKYISPSGQNVKKLSPPENCQKYPVIH